MGCRKLKFQVFNCLYLDFSFPCENYLHLMNFPLDNFANLYGAIPRESNSGPTPYEGVALPTELGWHF